MSIDEYWQMEPKQFAKHIKYYQKKKEQEIREKDFLNFLLGKYFMFTQSKKPYPSKPFLHKAKNKKMTGDEMEKVAKNITKQLKGTIQ